MKKDQHQHEAIISKENTVVRASAGSGKTSVIAQRYLHLVRDLQVPVTAILCLTFTRKAAGEMHERIYNLLQQEESPAVREQLLNFKYSYISTIDSFCTEIVNNNATSCGITPAGPTEPWEHKEFLYQLAIQVLGKHQSQALISRLIAHRGLHTCASLLMAKLVEQHSSLAYPLNCAELWEQTRAFLLEEREKIIITIHECIDSVMGLPTWEAPIIEKAQEALLPFQNEGSDLGTLFSVLSQFDLRKGTKRNSEISKDCVEYVKELRETSESLNQLGFLQEEHVVIELFNIIQEYQDLATQQKLEQSIYSYNDISELAIRILLDNHSIREHYKKQFRYIMIDEFQDNNARQRDLLYLLAEQYDHSKEGQPQQEDIEPNKLFFVGDEKQSIFSFRGADVRVFMQLAKEMSVRGKTITLETNYRSNGDLIEFFNTIFPQVMSCTNEYEAQYELTRAPESSTPSSQEGAAAEGASEHLPSIIKIATHPGKKEQPADSLLPVEAEAAWIAEEITQCIQSGIPPGDIAVLFRSSTNIRYYESALRHRNISYSAQATHSLLFEAPTNDLYILLRLYLYPEDRQNYACVLRSPLVRLSDNALTRILLEERNRHKNSPAHTEGSDSTEPQRHSTLFTTSLSLSTEDAAAMEAARRLYRSTGQYLSHMSTEQFVYLFWYQWGYNYVLLRNPAAHPYLEHFDHLLSIARSRRKSLAEFAERLGEHIRRSIRFDAGGKSTNTHTVQLMSIHASKGLEFPVVFVCDMASAEQNKKDSLFSTSHNLKTGDCYILPDYYPADFFETQKTNFLHQHEREQSEIQSTAEIKRLFYVALTRAKQHLFLSAHKKHRETGSSLYNLMPESLPAAASIRKTVQNITITDIPRQKEKKQEGRTRHHVKTLLETGSCITRTQYKNKFSITELSGLGRQAPIAAPASAPADPAAPTDPATPVEPASKAPYDPRLLGSLTHAILEQRITNPDYSYETVMQISSELYIQHEGTEDEKQISKEQSGLLQQEAWRLSQVFLESELWKDSPKDRTETELPFSYFHRTQEGKNTYINGRIDLLIESDSQITLVDYKTDAVVDTDDHILQLAMYERVCRVLYKQKNIRCYLSYLKLNTLKELTKEVQDFDLEESLDQRINKAWEQHSLPQASSV